MSSDLKINSDHIPEISPEKKQGFLMADFFVQNFKSLVCAVCMDKDQRFVVSQVKDMLTELQKGLSVLKESLLKAPLNDEEMSFAFDGMLLGLNSMGKLRYELMYMESKIKLTNLKKAFNRTETELKEILKPGSGRDEKDIFQITREVDYFCGGLVGTIMNKKNPYGERAAALERFEKIKYLEALYQIMMRHKKYYLVIGS